MKLEKKFHIESREVISTLSIEYIPLSQTLLID